MQANEALQLIDHLSIAIRNQERHVAVLIGKVTYQENILAGTYKAIRAGEVTPMSLIIARKNVELEQLKLDALRAKQN